MKEERIKHLQQSKCQLRACNSNYLLPRAGAHTAEACPGILRKTSSNSVLRQRNVSCVLPKTSDCFKQAVPSEEAEKHLTEQMLVLAGSPAMF